MSDEFDTVVLYNELAYEDVLPVQWQPFPATLGQFELIGLEEANVLLLQACVAVEEPPPRDTEDLGSLDSAIARLDFKLNLVMKLLDQLVSKERMPPPTRLRINVHGAAWDIHGEPPAIGDAGLLRVQLRSSLPQPLELPGEVDSVEGKHVTVKFPDLSERVGTLLQRLAFLRHRRQIADARKIRGV